MASLVTGLLGLLPIALVLSIVALVQIRRRGDRGHGLAVGGLATILVWVFASLMYAAANVSEEGGGDRSALQLFPGKGDCFDWAGGRGNVDTDARPCDEPHDGEVVTVFSLEKGPWPGVSAAHARGMTGCEKRIRQRFGTQTPVEDGETYILYPRQIGWKLNDRRVHCMIVATGDGKLERPLAAGDTGVREWNELNAADCFVGPEPGRERSRTVTVTECSEPHTGQLVHRFDLPEIVFPGVEELERTAEERCVRETRKLIKSPPEPLNSWYLAPGQESWAEGDRTVLCYVTAEKGELKKSLLPR